MSFERGLLDQKDLLKEVIKNNMIFFKDASSSYGTAKLGGVAS
jgi:hypothetical protein